MFSRRYRLSREEVSNVIRYGRVFHTPLFSLRILQNKLDSKEISHFRCAFVVSKKECRLSVGRNILKRRARMAVREISTDLSPLYFVVFPKKALGDADFKEVVEEFRNILV